MDEKETGKKQKVEGGGVLPKSGPGGKDFYQFKRSRKEKKKVKKNRGSGERGQVLKKPTLERVQPSRKGGGDWS